MYINNRNYTPAMVRNMSDEEISALASNTEVGLVLELARRLYRTTQPDVASDKFVENQLRRATNVWTK